MTLIARPTFSRRLEYLYTSVAEGRGISYVTDHGERDNAGHSGVPGEVADTRSVHEADPDGEYATKDQSEYSHNDQEASGDEEALRPSTNHSDGSEARPSFGVESQVANEDDNLGEQTRDRGTEQMTSERPLLDTVPLVDESKIRSTNSTIDDAIEEENFTDAHKEEFVLENQPGTSKDFEYDTKEVANNDAISYDFGDGDSLKPVDDNHVSVRREGESASSSRASSTIRGDGSLAVSDPSQAGELLDVKRNIDATAVDKPSHGEGIDNDGDYNDLGSDEDQIELFETSEADALRDDLHNARSDHDHTRSEVPTSSSVGDLETNDDDHPSNLEQNPGDVDLPPEGLTAEDSIPEDETSGEIRVELEEDEITYDDDDDKDTIEDDIAQQGRSHDSGEDTSNSIGSAAGSGSLKRMRAAEEDDDVEVDIDKTQGE